MQWYILTGPFQRLCVYTVDISLQFLRLAGHRGPYLLFCCSSNGTHCNGTLPRWKVKNCCRIWSHMLLSFHKDLGPKFWAASHISCGSTFSGLNTVHSTPGYVVKVLLRMRSKLCVQVDHIPPPPPETAIGQLKTLRRASHRPPSISSCLALCLLYCNVLYVHVIVCLRLCLLFQNCISSISNLKGLLKLCVQFSVPKEASPTYQLAQLLGQKAVIG